MLKVRIVAVERLLDLCVYQGCLAGLAPLLLSLRNLADALVDHGCCSCPHLHSLVLECFENVPVVGLLPEELVESYDRLLPAELSQDEDCGVLFDICRPRVRVLVEPLDGDVQ